MDITYATVDNREVEIAVLDERKTNRRYENIARAYLDYMWANANKKNNDVKANEAGKGE